MACYTMYLVYLDCPLEPLKRLNWRSQRGASTPKIAATNITSHTHLKVSLEHELPASLIIEIFSLIFLGLDKFCDLSS